MQYRIEIMGQALQASLAVLLLIFIPILLWSARHNRLTFASRLERARREYFEQHQERLPQALAAAIPRPPLLPAIQAALWIGLAAGAAAFFLLAFSVFSYFPNLRSVSPDRIPKLELKTLHADFQSKPMKIDGEVTNITSEILPELHVHLVLYDQNLAIAAVRTIDIERPFGPNETLPFFFSETRTEKIRRIGVTFSSRRGPITHKENAEAGQHVNASLPKVPAEPPAAWGRLKPTGVP
jgi:hypothetical protein